MKKLSGFSLLSVLIALGLTTFISAALIQAVIIGNDQFKTLNSIIDLNDRARTIHDYLYDLGSLAGFRSGQIPSQNIVYGVTTNYRQSSDTIFPQGAYVIPGINNTITFRIQKTGAVLPVSIVDCLGNPVFGNSSDEGKLLEIQIRRQGNNLLCQNKIIANNVEQFLVLYGRSFTPPPPPTYTDNDKIGAYSDQITSWVAYDPILTKYDVFLRSIRAIRFILLLSSKEEIYNTPQQQSFLLATISRDGTGALDASNQVVSAQDLIINTNSRKRYKLVNVFIPLKHIYVRSAFQY